MKKQLQIFDLIRSRQHEIPVGGLELQQLP